jgi:hypothetical protein
VEEALNLPDVVVDPHKKNNVAQKKPKIKK